MRNLRSAIPITLAALLVVACSGADDSYLPLASDQTLTYALQQTRSGDTLQQKLLTRMAGPVTVAGQTVYQEYTASGPQRLLQRQAAGVVEVGYYQGAQPVMLDTPFVLLPEPLTPASRWQAPVTTHLLEWRKHSLEKAGRQYRKTLTATFQCETLDDRIKTGVGTFNNVARVTAQGSETIEYGSLQEQAVIHVELTRWYAPGVGLIKSERREYADSREFNPGTASLVLERID